MKYYYIIYTLNTCIMDRDKEKRHKEEDQDLCRHTFIVPDHYKRGTGPFLCAVLYLGHKAPAGQWFHSPGYYKAIENDGDSKEPLPRGKGKPIAAWKVDPDTFDILDHVYENRPGREIQDWKKKRFKKFA